MQQVVYDYVGRAPGGVSLDYSTNVPNCVNELISDCQFGGNHVKRVIGTTSACHLSVRDK